MMEQQKYVEHLSFFCVMFKNKQKSCHFFLIHNDKENWQVYIYHKEHKTHENEQWIVKQQ